MFDQLDDLVAAVTVVDPGTDEVALVHRIAQLERLKAAAAAGQARAAAALDASRRSGEAEGVPAPWSRGRGSFRGGWPTSSPPARSRCGE
jgi:hypothetical protein